MSLRARLLLVLGVLLAIYAAVALAILSSQRDLLFEQVDRRLVTMQPNVATTVAMPAPGPAPGGQPPPELTGTEMEQAPLTDVFVAFVTGDGGVATLLAGGLGSGVPDVPAAIAAASASDTIVTVNATEGSDRFRALVMPAPAGGAGWLVVAQPLAEVDHTLERLERMLWAAGGIIALVLGLAFFWIQRLGLRPIARVTSAAQAIAAGDRSVRVDVADERTEAGRLGRAFNVMLDERDAAEDRLRQFIADASHELRTPLTSVRGYLELLRQGAFREPEKSDDVVRRLSAEASRMHDLVEDLLALASLDEGRPLRITRLDPGLLLRDAAQDARAVQPERSISVDVPDDGLSMDGDEALLAQLAGILTANALAHTPVTAPVTLSAREEGETVVLTVRDAGPGLDPETAAHVFDRFWRGDSSRTRAGSRAVKGGSGLGLAIARSITDAHSGTITLETSLGAGCTFVIRLPREQPAPGVA